MNFKDLQFSIGKLTTGAYSHLAKKNPLQKQDTKALSSWIFEERNALYLMRMNGHQHNESNQAFNQWLKDELNENATNNKDLEDIGDKLLRLLTKQNEVEEAYAGKLFFFLLLIHVHYARRRYVLFEQERNFK